MLTNLYIFVPSRRWFYCGGTITVIAKNFDQAVTLAKKSEQEKQKKSYNGIFLKSEEEIAKEERYWNCWLLAKRFKIMDNNGPRVLINNYNHA